MRATLRWAQSGQLSVRRHSDGYPLSERNTSMGSTMAEGLADDDGAPNAITAIQDALRQKVIRR